MKCALAPRAPFNGGPERYPTTATRCSKHIRLHRCASERILNNWRAPAAAHSVARSQKAWRRQTCARLEYSSTSQVASHATPLANTTTAAIAASGRYDVQPAEVASRANESHVSTHGRSCRQLAPAELSFLPVGRMGEVLRQGRGFPAERGPSAIFLLPGHELLSRSETCSPSGATDHSG